MSSEEQQTQQRQANFDALRALGIDQYPHSFDRTHTIHAIATEYGGLGGEDLEAQKPEVITAGRILSIRAFGKANFLVLSDGRARVQVYVRQDALSERDFKLYKLLDFGDSVGVAGRVFRTKTNELTIWASSLTFLAKSFLPLPEKWHGLQDIETRYRQRYLDLIVNPDSRRVFEVRSKVLNAIRHFLDSRGFLEVETPMMQPIAGGALARPFITHHNALDMPLYLRIAPELYLKRLTVGGMERVYEINRNFRNEGISTQHNPEFTMLEFYQAYTEYQALMRMTEEMIAYVAQEAVGTDTVPFGDHTISLKPPYRRLSMRVSARPSPTRMSERRIASPRSRGNCTCSSSRRTAPA
jgi:lysyl-tRNA synthetase class 2